jgi:hypothetical protein
MPDARSPSPLPSRVTQGTLDLGSALGASQPLVLLMQRLEASRRRYELLRGLLPEALRDQVRPGPLDDKAWSLLVPSGAAAAKLRQCIPTLDAALLEHGWPALPIRVKVHSRDA